MPQKFWGETGGDLVVEALEREGVTAVFGNSPCLFLSAALERSKSIRTSPKELAAALSYSRFSSTGLPAVCCLNDRGEDCLKEAIVSNTPVVIILIDGWSSAPSKCTYRVSELLDIPNIVKEAFSLASSGPCPSPVVINFTSSVTGPTREDERLLYNKFKPIVKAILKSKKPVLYMEDGGCLSRSSEEVRRFVELTCGIPLASSSNGHSPYLHLEHHHKNNKNKNQSSPQILGDVCADYAVRESGLLLAFGVRYDDVLASHILKENRRKNDYRKKNVIHIIEDDEKLSEKQQDKKDFRSYKRLYSDVKLALRFLNDILEINRATSQEKPDLSAWRAELFTATSNMVSNFVEEANAIQTHHVTQILNELTKDIKVIITTSRDIEHEKSIESTYGWEAAIGAAVVSDPNAIVVHINGFGQEYGITKPKDLEIKIITLDYSYKCRNLQDWARLLELNETPSACVTERAELRGAIKKMLETCGSYLLQVMIQPKPLFPDVSNVGVSVTDRILVL